MIAIASLVLVFLKKVIRSSDLRNLGCKLFETDDSTATAMIRLVLGVVFFAHGAQKMLGWFGGFGFSATMGFFTGTMHIPAPLAFLATRRTNP